MATKCFTPEQEQRYNHSLQFRNGSKELVKHVSKVIQSTQIHTEDEQVLSRYLDELVKEEWLKEGTELDVPKFMRYLATTVKAVAAVRQNLGRDMEAKIVDPLNNMADYDFLEVTELKAKVEQTQAEYDQTCKKIETILTSKSKKKKDALFQEQQIQKFEADLERLRKDLDRHTADFEDNLQELHHKKETKLLRIMLTDLQLQYDFYEKAYKLMNNLRPKLEFLEAELSQAENKTARGVYKEGHLMKKSNQMGGSGWIKCWYVLKEGLLFCYKGKKDTQEEKALNVVLCKARIPHGKFRKDEYVFELLTPDKKKPIILKAENDRERQGWMKALQDAIESGLMDSVIDGEKSSLSSKRKGDKGGEDENRVFRIIQRAPGNLVCADCPNENPEWASINLGILLCLECSGVHRSLGTHISKVRSMTLDTRAWEPELIMFMKAAGNERFNAVFEASLPPHTKPTSSEERTQLTRYIKAKHVAREYIMEPPTRDEDWLNSELYSRVATTDDDPMALLHLIGCGADPNWHHPQDEDKTSLHTAVVFDKVMYLEVLIQNGGDIYQLESRQWTPMHYAAYYNRVHCASLLAQHGFNKKHFEYKDWQNKTASEVANDNEAFDIIKVLSGEKVDVGPTIDDLDDGLQQPDPVEEEEDDSRPERVQSMIVQRPKMEQPTTMRPFGTMKPAAVSSLQSSGHTSAQRRASAPPPEDSGASASREASGGRGAPVPGQGPLQVPVRPGRGRGGPPRGRGRARPVVPPKPQQTGSF